MLIFCMSDEGIGKLTNDLIARILIFSLLIHHLCFVFGQFDLVLKLHTSMLHATGYQALAQQPVDPPTPQTPPPDCQSSCGTGTYTYTITVTQPVSL